MCLWVWEFDLYRIEPDQGDQKALYTDCASGTLQPPAGSGTIPRFDEMKERVSDMILSLISRDDSWQPFLSHSLMIRFTPPK